MGESRPYGKVAMGGSQELSETRINQYIYIETEAVALNWAVQTMRSLGYKQVIYETDSLVLPKMIAGSEKIWPKLKPIIQDLTQSLSELPGSIV